MSRASCAKGQKVAVSTHLLGREREWRVRELAQTQEHLIVCDSAAQRKRGDVSLHMEANNRRRAEGTCRQAKSFAL